MLKLIFLDTVFFFCEISNYYNYAVVCIASTQIYCINYDWKQLYKGIIHDYLAKKR
jgi:hypothetical protein